MAFLGQFWNNVVIVGDITLGRGKAPRNNKQEIQELSILIKKQNTVRKLNLSRKWKVMETLTKLTRKKWFQMEVNQINLLR